MMHLFNTLPDWLAHLEKAHPIPVDLGRERCRAVKNALQLAFKCPIITVGGTNGKGSICALLESTLLPHFEAVERARHAFAEPVSLTYFEFTVLAILHSFAARALDAVILEVGLGGRLDAVNIMDTDCAIISSIDLDHIEFLGDTREKIGFEKA